MANGKVAADELEKAYRKTGLEPRRSMYLSQDCACGLGVVYAQRTGERKLDSRSEIQNCLGLSHEYCRAFERGFDGSSNQTAYGFEWDPLAFEDGKAAWKRAQAINLKSTLKTQAGVA